MTGAGGGHYCRRWDGGMAIEGGVRHSVPGERRYRRGAPGGQSRAHRQLPGIPLSDARGAAGVHGPRAGRGQEAITVARGNKDSVMFMHAVSGEPALDTPGAGGMVSMPESGGLLAWLDEGVESNGERYTEMRRRLVWYFDRWRRADPGGLADETFRRISGMLARAKAIGESPARYCYLVAREVLLEESVRNGRQAP